MSPAIGFDVGGQFVKAVLVSDGGEVLTDGRAPTGETTDIARLCDVLASLRAELAAGDHPVGLGIAGVTDREGVLKGAPHLPLLVGESLASVIGEAIGSRVHVHNDADCAAVAEGWGGAATGRADFLVVAVGTGVGAGLVLDSKLRVGASGYGCEFGHSIVVEGGRRCGCGNRGCLEAYVSETAARHLVEEASPDLARCVREHRERGGGYAQALFELGAAGDTAAEELAGSMIDKLGTAIASAVNLLDLSTVVIGGGIGPAIVRRSARLREAAGRSLFARPASDLELLAASRGPLAGAIGAARLAMLAH